MVDVHRRRSHHEEGELRWAREAEPGAVGKLQGGLAGGEIGIAEEEERNLNSLYRMRFGANG